MKSLVILIVLLILLSGCATHTFVISTTKNQELEILINNQVKGVVKKGSKLEFSTSTDPSLMGEINARKRNYGDKNFFGLIEYGRPDNNEISVVAQINAKEIKKEINEIYNNDIIRYIEFGDNSKTSSGFGYIKLTSNQKDVEIYVNHELVGNIVDEKPFNKKLKIGDHTIMAKKEFFMPYTIETEILDKDIFQFHFELQNVKGWIEETPESKTIRQARGNLTLATEMNDYKVYIEGYEKIPPFELKNIPAGKYSVRIVRPGFERTITISVNDNEDKFVDLDEILK
jgi:hypothetical protein